MREVDIGPVTLRITVYTDKLRTEAEAILYDPNVKIAYIRTAVINDSR
jgi:hypothetical protein